MGRLFALFGTTILIFCPSVIEGSEINFLRVWRQMRTNGWRKVVDRCVWQAYSFPLNANRCQQV